MSAKPWYAWYVGDWRSKTTRLSLLEKGAYRELIDEYYAMQEALPQALDELCRICSAITEQEKAAVARVSNTYFTLKNNKLHHERIDKELARRDEIQQKLSTRGKAGAEARWNASSNASSITPDMAYPQSQATVTVTPTARKVKPSQPKASLNGAFIDFWQAYPRKVAKGAAERAWIAAKPDPELEQAILQAVQRAKQSDDWKRDSGKFIPHPATWLNQKRWLDEMTTKPTLRELVEKNDDIPP